MTLTTTEGRFGEGSDSKWFRKMCSILWRFTREVFLLLLDHCPLGAAMHCQAHVTHTTLSTVSWTQQY